MTHGLLGCAGRRDPASSVAPEASGYERSLRPWLAVVQRTRTARDHSEMSSDDVAIEAVEPETVVGELLGQVVDVWTSAHGLVRASATRREFGGDRVPRHAAREGFRFFGAFGPPARLLGFVYGYTGAPGQWWYDKVRAALDAETRAAWVEQPHFELTELAVDPAAQGGGIGSRLHDVVLDGLPHDRALLSALSDNERVLRFYRDRGWHVLLPQLRFEPRRPLFAILGKELHE
jgi:ribosomal protein S18 acetylase RimI-like enzyme